MQEHESGAAKQHCRSTTRQGAIVRGIMYPSRSGGQYLEGRGRLDICFFRFAKLSDASRLQHDTFLSWQSLPLTAESPHPA